MIRSWRAVSTARRRGFEDLAQLESIALALVEIGRGGRERVERLEPLGALDPLADHVDRPDQLAALGRVVGQDLGQVELTVAGLGEQAAADLLRAVVPEPGVEPGIPPADRAIALNVADQVRLGRLRR